MIGPKTRIYLDFILKSVTHDTIELAKTIDTNLELVNMIAGLSSPEDINKIPESLINDALKQWGDLEVQ